MARKRERFERIDVPQRGPYTNVIGLVVCVLALAATALLVRQVWNHVQLESHLEDGSLSDAVAAQGSTIVPDGGYVATADSVSCTLLLVADGLEEADSALTSAHILAVNQTQGTAVLANVALETKLTYQEESTTLASLFMAEGYAACVAPLSSACNAIFSHVVVSEGEVLEDAVSLAGMEAGMVVFEAADLLGRIRTDMDAASLISLAGTLSGLGVSNLASADAVLVAETVTDEAGNVTETGYQLVDRAQLGLALGLLVVPSA